MGNINSNLGVISANKHISELTIKNNAMEEQINIMKEMLKSDNELIKALKSENQKLTEDNRKFKKIAENNCVICNYFDKQ